MNYQITLTGRQRGEALNALLARRDKKSEILDLKWPEEVRDMLEEELKEIDSAIEALEKAEVVEWTED